MFTHTFWEAMEQGSFKNLFLAWRMRRKATVILQVDKIFPNISVGQVFTVPVAVTAPHRMPHEFRPMFGNTCWRPKQVSISCPAHPTSEQHLSGSTFLKWQPSLWRSANRIMSISSISGLLTLFLGSSTTFAIEHAASPIKFGFCATSPPGTQAFGLGVLKKSESNLTLIKEDTKRNAASIKADESYAAVWGLKMSQHCFGLLSNFL